MDFVKNLYRYKRLRHIAVGRHLLHDIAFSVHGLFCMEDKGLPRARLLRIVADLPNSIARHLMFQLSTSSRCFCCGSFPSAPHRGHVPIVVRRLARFPGASRHSCSHSRHRCSHSQTRHRHSRSHGFCPFSSSVRCHCMNNSSVGYMFFSRHWRSSQEVSGGQRWCWVKMCSSLILRSFMR